MQESEQALEDAAGGSSIQSARIARRILYDRKIHHHWESRHASLLRPVAEQRKRSGQIIEMRKLDASLLHRSALIDYVRSTGVTGGERDRLFSLFYAPLDVNAAVRLEERQYLLAKSSAFAAHHLLDVMDDPTSHQLLQLYRSAYSSYFSLYCYFVGSADSVMATAIGSALHDARQRVDRLRGRLLSSRPARRAAVFERQALLARSGRYPAVNYLNR